MADLVMIPIGSVRSSRSVAADDGWDSESSAVILADNFGPEALAGLDAFSHVEVLYAFHAADATKTEHASRHPRGNTAWPKVGIFAQRGRDRPNHIGATICRVLRVQGRELHLIGLDAIDGTPVLDLKPWFVEFGPRGEVKQPDWSHDIMREYWAR